MATPIRKPPRCLILPWGKPPFGEGGIFRTPGWTWSLDTWQLRPEAYGLWGIHSPLSLPPFQSRLFLPLMVYHSLYLQLPLLPGQPHSCHMWPIWHQSISPPSEMACNRKLLIKAEQAPSSWFFKYKKDTMAT